MRELARLDALMPLTLEERGALVTLAELAAERAGFVPDQERWVAGWMQCSVRKWRLIRDTLIAKGHLVEGSRAGERGFIIESATNQPRTNVEPTTSHARKVAENETKVNEINDPSRVREARGEDITSNSVGTCSGGGVGGGARDATNQADDWPEGDLVEILVAAAESPWLDPHKSLGLVTGAGRLDAWRKRGASWTRHVLPVVVALAKANAEPIRDWKFFQPAVTRAVQASRADIDFPEGVVPLRPGGGVSFAAQQAAEHAEARRRALAMLEKRNGQST